MEIVIKPDLFNKIYKAGDVCTGKIDITNPKTLDYDKINIILTGYYTIKNSKVTPPTTSTIKFFNKKVKIQDKGKFNNKSNHFSYTITLIGDNDNVLYETYQGVLFNIQVSTINIYITIISINNNNIKQYELQVEIANMKTSEPKKINIIVPNQGVKDQLKKRIVPYEFNISNETLEKIKIQETPPKFLINCKVNNTNVELTQELNGYVIIKHCEIPIKSVELQFVRNEKVVLSNGETLTEMSEIQNLQIGDGDVLRDNEIPLNMVFPRFFCSANLETKLVKLSFEINIILVLKNGFIVTENVPLNLWRN